MHQLSRTGGHAQEKVVGRKRCAGRIAREANVPGKAGGYADAGTMVWKVEERVGVERS